MSVGEVRETLNRRTANIEAMQKQEYESLYKTKDIYIAAFFLARGMNWTGLEEYITTKTTVKAGKNYDRKNNLIYFLFPNKSECSRLALHYHNSNRVNLNVNANSFVSSILNVRSIITDPPF